jgi:diaminopimelate decarboxylase
MNDYFHYQNDALYVEEVPLAEIAAQFGTPCYVYSRAALTDSMRQFTDALRGREHLICYSVKANSNLAILNVLAGLGAGFDIVSGGELQRVLAAGGDARKVVFSGVGKTIAEMRMALDGREHGENRGNQPAREPGCRCQNSSVYFHRFETEQVWRSLWRCRRAIS